MRITLVISSLGAGGAEKILSLMANYWAVRGQAITLITLDSANTDFYPTNPLINRISLSLMKTSSSIWAGIHNNLLRLKRLRQGIIVSRPDVILSFGDQMNILTLLAARGLKTPVIVSERTDPSRHYIGGLWSLLRRWVYPFAHAVVVQSETVSRWINAFVNKNRIYVIPNPVYPPKPVSVDIKKTLPDGINIVAMGRLGPEKGFDILLDAFAQCAVKYKHWRLTILGEGIERGRLEHQAEMLGVAHLVSFPGRLREPVSILRQADLFVMSSRYEGFPNALLEAMACGLPVISFDCPSGPREIIRPGEDGILVPPESVSALAEAMEQLMLDEDLRKKLGTRAREVIQRFGIDKVMKMWDEVINEVKELLK